MKYRLHSYFFSVLCGCLLLTACGGSDDSGSPKPSPDPQKDFIAKFQISAINFTSSPLEMQLECREHCSAFNKVIAKNAAVQIDKQIVPAASSSSEPRSHFNNLSYEVPLDQQPVLHFSYDNGQGCSKEFDRDIIGRPGDASKTFLFTATCGEPPTQVEARLYKKDWPLSMPTNTDDINVTLSTVGSQSQNSDQSSYQVTLSGVNNFYQNVDLPLGVRYHLSFPKLLNSCDCVTAAPEEVTLEKLDRIQLRYTVAPQRQMTSAELNADFTANFTPFLATMSQGGYNTVALTGLHLGQDATYGTGQLQTKDGTSVYSLIRDGLERDWPSYIMPLLQIDWDDSWSQAQPLTEALSSLFFTIEDLGVTVKVNAASQHYDDWLQLLETLDHNGTSHTAVVLNVPSDASDDDLKAIANLEHALIETSAWHGWVQLTANQLQTIRSYSDLGDAAHWVVDMRSESASADKVVNDYQALSTLVNGLMVNVADWSDEQIASLRQAVFLSASR